MRSENGVRIDGGLEAIQDPQAMREINERLRAMMEDAPSDASAELIMRSVERGGFKGFLKVCSQQGKFIGGSAGPRVIEVMNNIFEEVTTQIRLWKRTRSLSSAQD